MERHSFKHPQGWEFAVLSATCIPPLIVGTVPVMVGSLSIGNGCPLRKQEFGEVLCWLASGISVWLLNSVGNVHGWTFAFIFPAFAGFVTGAVRLSKLNDGAQRK